MTRAETVKKFRAAMKALAELYATDYEAAAQISTAVSGQLFVLGLAPSTPEAALSQPYPGETSQPNT